MIREILRTRDNQEIALGQKCKFAPVPTRRHTRWQRVGVQSDNPSSEKLNTLAQDSYLGTTPYLEYFCSWAYPKNWPEVAGIGNPKPAET